ncbi:LTV1 ribosome biogenesis factor isoform X2 [Arctopsyche grandis]|uniref:LTV1 ribosome biogenesis factor isoform X2 n=1 Tax=Arctopsyche grandis TaxID=121162 RepID=UPI00406D856B
MGKTKKKFIDKKNAVTFHLVHRSQRDPLVADETAPQHVLVEAAAKQHKGEVVKRQEEQRKWGVFYDDDYDYLQHLRDMKELSVIWAPSKEKELKPVKNIEEACKKENEPRLILPSSVFASEVEESVGMLNKAAPQTSLRLDLDPDIVAAMDEDFNYDDPENELEDNFMELAMCVGADEGEEECSEEEYDDDNQSQVGYASDNQWSGSEDGDADERKSKFYDNEDAKSRFSQYSMSSSIMRRNNGLSLLDDKFEKMFAEYDDTEIGALVSDDIEGHLPATTDVLQKYAEHFHNQRRMYKLDEDKEAKEVVKLAQLREVSDEEDNEDDLFGKEEEVKEKWDCESILSTYSNLYNHPRLIDEPKRLKKIRISPITGIPVGVLNGDAPKLTIKSLAKFNVQQAEIERAENGDDDESICESVMSTLSVLSLRPKNETPEEKKERKRLLKEYRQERRIEKKANTNAFKEEKKQQDRILVNNKKNIQGIKIV